MSDSNHKKLYRSRALTALALLLVALCTWVAALAVSLARPAVSIGAAAGLYSEPGDAPAYRWTSNRVRFPIQARGGPTLLTLGLGDARWPGRAAPLVMLAAGDQPLAAFEAPERPRRYHLLLPASATAVSLQTSVDQPPRGDSRWLGVPLYELSASATGLPLQAALLALLPALASVPLALAAAWSARRGYAPLFGLTALAVLLRVVLLDVTPPGFSQDEAVSLVDAWHLARTGHDHLGNLLPLGAQEALGDWISPLLTYLELPAVALFGPERLVGRLMTGLFGALAAPVVYAIARRLRLPEAAAICAGAAAAISPWQVFLSRFALPPALVPTSWALCLLAGLAFVQRGGRREALWLALTAGVALYSYPTMKLAAPLLAGWAAALGLLRYGRAGARRWLPAALLIALLWLPFSYVTLFNPASSTRLDQAALRADTPTEWLAAWWQGYSVYFRPELYFLSGDGDPIHGLPGRGIELPIEAPLVLLGLGALLWHCLADKSLVHLPSNLETQNSELRTQNSKLDWWFVLGALLLAPLPASLTFPSPHAFRAATIAPLYALMVGLGVAVAWAALGRIAQLHVRRVARGVAIVALAAALAWQAGDWLRSYVREYPAQVATSNQDGMIEAMRYAVRYAPDFSEVWISNHDVAGAYIYLLAAQPMPPAEIQARIAVTRRPGHLNHITGVDRYRFDEFGSVPKRMPVLEAIPDRSGGPAFVLQEWRQDGERVLIVRRMQ